MKLINQSHEILKIDTDTLQLIEKAGRTCYKSESNITDESSEKFCDMLIRKGHHSVIEHAGMTVRFITNRGVTHELVRHRLCSFSQESTRYVNYKGGDMEFILPVWWNEWSEFDQEDFMSTCRHSEIKYNALIERGSKAERARDVLPNSLKTEIIVTANLREWRHIFKLRTHKTAHPQIRQLMIDCLQDVKKRIPIIFDKE